MAKGNERGAYQTQRSRELNLPDGEYVVIDEQGHEAFIPRRTYHDRDSSASISVTNEEG
jgi:hypothetical protein